jgi:hypothetical protein
MKAFRVFLAVISSLICSFLLTAAVLLEPPLAYFYFSPSTQDGCSRVHAGLTHRQVIEAVHSSSDPYSEYGAAQNRLIFRGPHAACTVSFDPASDVAVNIERRPLGYHEFLEETMGDY